MIHRRFRDTDLNFALYDHIIVAFSGGKDSVAAVLRLFELGASPAKVELWHHLVDGREGSTMMDWPCTEAYCEAFVRHFGLRLYHSWKEGGFEREMNRENERTAPVHFEAPLPDGSTGMFTVGGTGGKPSTRRRFPQVSADLKVRWCSAYLKIDPARSILRNQERFRHARTLVVSGERAEESPGRAAYAPFEPHETDARKSPKLRRHIDRFRPVHGWPEEEVWGIIERWRVNAHPAYHLGWGRCSCAPCIFNGPDQFATLRLINPEQFACLVAYERDFDVTMKRAEGLLGLADRGTPYDVAPEAMRAALSGTYDASIILDPWVLPAGAYGDSTGPT